MKSARKHLIYVLLLALPLSSWAGSFAPCAQAGEPLPIQESVDDGIHAHHGGEQPDSAAQGDYSATADCSCSGDCVDSCAMSVCAPAAFASPSFESFCSVHGSDISLVDRSHANPVPHPLFRPPIAIS